ncbi:MAG: septum formation initiator [Candidatus Latescibacterota bacterium]|nr:MAG: septum formation initiator [Candidatus Latescibacterota bacterium]RKY72045.1 MAG: septum formation initiator [Candidatus Latescibacterota bacterium]HDN67431.1 DivIVA domain-containing protein [Bacillota bacterium]
MKITALDLRKQEFKKAFRGYDTEEVDAFLEIVAAEFEQISRKDASLREKIESLEAALAEYRNLEKTLQSTLLAAQKTTEETKANAQREADLIVRDAEIRAEKIVDRARAELNRINQEIANLKTQRDSFLARLKSLLNYQMYLLETMESGEIPTPGKNKEAEEPVDEPAESQLHRD